MFAGTIDVDVANRKAVMRVDTITTDKLTKAG
jgi:hypothetical protein